MSGQGRKGQRFNSRPSGETEPRTVIPMPATLPSGASLTLRIALFMRLTQKSSALRVASVGMRSKRTTELFMLPRAMVQVFGPMSIPRARAASGTSSRAVGRRPFETSIFPAARTRPRSERSSTISPTETLLIPVMRARAAFDRPRLSRRRLSTLQVLIALAVAGQLSFIVCPSDSTPS